MFKIKSNRFNFLLAGVLSVGLTACGGGGGSPSTNAGQGGGALPGAGLKGTKITTTNLSEFLKSGLDPQIQGLSDFFVFSQSIASTLASAIQPPSAPSGSTEVQLSCPDGGTDTVTPLSATNKQQHVFQGCLINGGSASVTGTVEVTDDGSTNAQYYPDLASDWDIKHSLVLTNFAVTENNMTTTYTGNVVTRETNDVTSSVQTNQLSSSDLVMTKAGQTTTFSNINYKSVEGSPTQADIIDYTASISPSSDPAAGDIQLTVNPVLEFDSNGNLTSGGALVTTGTSTVKITATGNDNVDVEIDPENDGSFEPALQTTFNSLFN